MRKILKLICLLVYIINGQNFLYSSSINEEYEGWLWRSSLNFILPDNTAINVIDTLHRNLSDSRKEVIGKAGGATEDRNTLFIRLGVITQKDEEEYDYKITDCFEGYMFVSGQANPNFSYIQGTQILKVEPDNYPYDLDSISKKLSSRFGAYSSEIQTILGKKVYQEQNFRKVHELFQKSLENINKVEDENSDELRGVSIESIANLEESISYFYDKHTHSEQKLLFFLDRTLDNIPYYWNLGINTAFKNFVQAAESLIVQKFRLSVREKNALSKTDVLEELGNFNKKYIQEQDTPEAKKNAPNWKKAINEIKSSIKPIDLGAPEADLHLTWKDFYKYFEEYYEWNKVNPLNLKKIHTSFSFVEEMDKVIAFYKIIQNKAYKNKEALNEDLKKIKDMKNYFELKPNQKWLNDFPQTEYISVKGKITALILHLHSYFDICESCAPSIAREIEKEEGTVAKLKSILVSYNKRKDIPSIYVLASCDKIRDEESENQGIRLNFKDKYSDKQNYIIPLLNNKSGTFFQMLIKKL